MRQVTQSRYGGPDVLEIREGPRPVPGESEVLIRIDAFSVTLADCAFRKADPFITRFFTGLVRPRNLVLGDDIGGVVEAVGSKVSRIWHMLTKRNPGKRGKLATTGLRPVNAKLRDLQALVGLVEMGAVQAVTDRRFPLAQVADAHRYVETESKAGDVVVEMVHAT